MNRFDQETLNRFLVNLQSDNVECHAISVYQDGRNVLNKAFHPFRTKSLHPLYSVTKSFTSIAFGFMQEEKHLNLDSAWIQYFPEYKEQATEKFKRVTLRHLLTMTMGQDAEAMVQGEDNWISAIARRRIVYDPGTKFFYNSMCSYLIGRLVERETKLKMSSFLEKKLFKPLGIKDFYWEEDREGHCLGGYGLHLSTEDLCKFGVCLLNNGSYLGKQVIPKKYIKEATSLQVSNESEYPASRTENRQGYGYFFWRCSRSSYRCSGLHGQLCYINPKNKLVIAMSNSTTGSQAVLNSLYRAMDSKGAVPQFSCYRIPLLQGLGRSDILKKTSESYTALNNPAGITAMTVRQNGNELHLMIEKGVKSYKFISEEGEWKEQPNRIAGFTEFYSQNSMKSITVSRKRSMFVNHSWLTPTTLQLQIRALDCSSAWHFVLRFDPDYVELDYSVTGLYTSLPAYEVIFKR